MTKDELKQKQKDYKNKYGFELTKWENRIYPIWEIKLLKELQAINEDRILVQPMLLVKSKKTGDTKRIENYGGIIQKINEVVKMINAEKKDDIASLEYYPHIYANYLALDKQIKDDEYGQAEAKKQQEKLQDNQEPLP